MPASRKRDERHYSDEQIRAIVRRQAETPAGVSRVLMKDRFYTYPDRQRVGEIIELMVREGELYSAYFPGGNGRGRGSTRAFVHRADGVAFAAGLGPTAASTVPLKLRQPKPAAAVPSAKPASEALVVNRPPMVAPAHRADTRHAPRELPPGYVSALNPAEARPWAHAAATSRT